jgi:hypothetical protein
MKDGQQDEGEDDRHGQGAQAAKTAGEEEKHLDRLLRYCRDSRGWMALGRTTCLPSAIGDGYPRALLTETCLGMCTSPASPSAPSRSLRPASPQPWPTPGPLCPPSETPDLSSRQLAHDRIQSPRRTCSSPRASSVCWLFRDLGAADTVDNRRQRSPLLTRQQRGDCPLTLSTGRRGLRVCHPSRCCRPHASGGKVQGPPVTPAIPQVVIDVPAPAASRRPSFRRANPSKDA